MKKGRTLIFAIKNTSTMIVSLAIVIAMMSLSACGSTIDESKITVGSGEAGFVDGKDARFNKPIRMAPFGPGKILVADISNQAIRIVSKNGEVTTIAGGPDKKGHKDGPASAAMFDGPHGVAVSKEGVIAVAGASSHTVRLITPTGNGDYIVSTLAGTPGESGMQDGPVNKALFNSPHGLVYDNDGGLLVVDIGNGGIRRIKAGMVTTVLPAGTDGMEMPIDIGHASDGTFLIADAGNNKALSWDGGTTVTAVAMDRELKTPHGVWGGPDGSVYVAEMGTHNIVRLKDGKVAIVAGTSKEGSDDLSLNKPAAVLVHDGLLWIADLNNHRIKVLPLNAITQ
ncbi:MAG: hypothetical protein L3J65_11630 [Robiginitomaculum sp.]|nr:hypothetical protein [Robiginitomaculum sp.]